MNEQIALSSINQIVSNLLPGAGAITMEQAVGLANGISLPSERTALDGGVVYSRSAMDKIIAMDRMAEYATTYSLQVEDAQSMPSTDQIIERWGGLGIILGNRNPDSQDIANSDTVYSSQRVFLSYDITSSSNVFLSERILHSTDIFASTNVSNSQRCWRAEESKECNDSAFVWWTTKAVRSYYVSDCYDVVDCMFCAHITNKQYCIANVQYTEDQYNQLKPQLLQWIKMKRGL